MTELAEENRELIERHIRKNGPAKELAETILKAADNGA